MSRKAYAQFDDLHARVSDFIVNEAELLDERQLSIWFDLFEPEARYRVLPLQTDSMDSRLNPACTSSPTITCVCASGSRACSVETAGWSSHVLALGG